MHSDAATGLGSTLALALLVAAPAGAGTIMPLGDSLTEGLCTDGGAANTPTATCYQAYYEPDNAYVYNHYASEPTFCGEFARHMVEDYNHGVAGGYRGPLLDELRAAGLDAEFVGSVRSGSALASVDRAHEGHGNWIVEQLDYCANGHAAHAGMPAFAGYVALVRPDLVLLLAGTNNLYNGESGTALADEVLDLYRNVARKAPHARVLLALVPRRWDFTATPPRPEPVFEAARRVYAESLARDSGLDFPCSARDLPDMAVLEAADMTPVGAAGVHPNAQGYAKIGSIWAAAVTAPECRFDTRTFVTLGGVLIESLTAYGRFWNFDAATAAPIRNGPLNDTAIPRYAAICQGHPVCTFDTRTFVGDESAAIESITAFGNRYEFDPNGSAVSSGALRSIAHYVAVCDHAADGADCVFDTRAVFTRGGTRIETITAYGRWFDFNYATHATLGSGTLGSVARYTPICALKPPTDAQCRFDTRAFVRRANGTLLESITAYARYWDYDTTSGSLVDSGSLAGVARYRANDAILIDGFDR